MLQEYRARRRDLAAGLCGIGRRFRALPDLADFRAAAKPVFRRNTVQASAALSLDAPVAADLVIPLTTQHYPMLQRNLLKHRGHPRQAAGRHRRSEESYGAVKGKQTGRRCSKLKEWMHEPGR